MSTIMTTNSIPKEILPGYAQFTALGYEEYPKQWDKVYDVSKTDLYEESRTLLSGLGMAALVNETQAVSYDSFNQRYTKRYRMLKYGLGLALSAEFKKFSLKKVVETNLMQELGKALSRKKDQIHADLINGATDTAVYTTGDGVAIGSTAHLHLTGTYSNRLSSDSDLSESSYEQAVIEMHSMKDERGNRIAAPKVRKLLIPRELQFEAARLFGSDKRPGTPDNDINALVKLGLAPEIIAWDLLTDIDSWYLITDVPQGLTSFNAMDMTISMDNDFNKDVSLYKALEMYACGVTDPRGIFVCIGA